MTSSGISDQAGTADPWTPRGGPPSARYEALAARFRPVFDRIRADAIDRERHRRLPFEAIAWLREAGFGAVRLPESYGGAGADVAELLELLTELAAADSNLTQALRVHFGFAEDTLGAPHDAHRDIWLDRIGKGALFGGAWSETGPTPVGTFLTRIHRRDRRWRLTGRKYYTTGSLYADWIDVTGLDEAGEEVAVIVPAKGPGVEVVDDWDGFGQTLTASGTAIFHDALVEGEPVRSALRLPYAPAFYQAVHLATLTGIARAAADETALAVRLRTRAYSHGAAARSALDPQILQVVGRLHASAYAAAAITRQAAEAVQRAYEARVADLPEDAAKAINIQTELELGQAQSIVTTLVLDSTTILFDALGASAISLTQGLDRHWRNARAISSHNPRVYKDRVTGDYAVNRTEPPFQWKIGRASNVEPHR